MGFLCTDFAVFVPELGADEHVCIQVCGLEWARVYFAFFF